MYEIKKKDTGKTLECCSEKLKYKYFYYTMLAV